MHKPQEQVRSFHKEILEGPTSPAEPKLRNPLLRARLILEEAAETVAALVGTAAGRELMRDAAYKMPQHAEPNLIEAIDGLVDLLYVTYGSFEGIGLDAEPFFDEVHASNMRKRDPERKQQVTLSPIGKVLKPEGWSPPDIAGVLAQVKREREYVAALEREPPNINDLTPEQYREMAPWQRAIYVSYWSGFCCIGCGFPTDRGRAVCSACGDHPEIRFEVSE